MKSRKDKLQKRDLDLEIVSLFKTRQDFSNILYYFKKIQDTVASLIEPLDAKLKRIMNLYPLL